MRTFQISSSLFKPMCLALVTFLTADAIGQERFQGNLTEQIEDRVKSNEARQLQSGSKAAIPLPPSPNTRGFQRPTPKKTTKAFPAPSPQPSPNQLNTFGPKVNRNLLPSNNPQQPALPTLNQRMPFGPSTGLPFNSNRTARQPSLRAPSYNAAPKFSSNAKSVKKLYRADYEVDEASATMLQKLLTAKGEDKVEAKVMTDDSGLTHLRVTTDEQTQMAIGNFLAQVFPAPAKPKSAKVKPKAASTTLRADMKFVSVKTPKMTCGGCAASVRATLAEAKCSEIKCDSATKTCTFKVKNDINEKELLNSLAKDNHLLKDWEISKE